MRLASCSEDRVYLWDIATGCQLDSAGPPLDIRHEPSGNSISVPDLLNAWFSKHGPCILCACTSDADEHLNGDLTVFISLTCESAGLEYQAECWQLHYTCHLANVQAMISRTDGRMATSSAWSVSQTRAASWQAAAVTGPSGQSDIERHSAGFTASLTFHVMMGAWNSRALMHRGSDCWAGHGHGRAPASSRCARCV